jgi:hypothetical protein
MKFHSTYRSLNFYEQQEIGDVGFSTKEIEKIIRIKDIFVSDYELESNAFDSDKKDLLNFVKEYEVRRGYKVEEYFPELTNFFNTIEDEDKL